MNYVIGVNPNNNNQPSVTLTVESTNLLLGIAVSFSIIIGGVVKIITKFNHISEKIRDLEEIATSNAKAIQGIETLKTEMVSLDKQLAIHLQDYTNKDTLHAMILEGFTERINTNKERYDKEMEIVDSRIRQLERYLQTSASFRIRE